MTNTTSDKLDDLLFSSGTTTTVEAELMDEAWCRKCKASKGHFTHQHEDWLKC